MRSWLRVQSSIGGNTGEVNSFVGVDIADVTGGVLNTAKLLEGNHLICFVMEVVKTITPNSLSSLFRIIDVPLKLLTNTVGSALVDITGCPSFSDLTMGGADLQSGLKSQFPGARSSGAAL